MSAPGHVFYFSFRFEGFLNKRNHSLHTNNNFNMNRELFQYTITKRKEKIETIEKGNSTYITKLS